MKKQVMIAAAGLVLAVGMSAGAQVVVRIAPPAAIVETPGPAPHEGWVYQRGYHRWDGEHYVWVPGTWVEPPHEHARWVEGHWAHRDGGYVWVEGHWR